MSKMSHATENDGQIVVVSVNGPLDSDSSGYFNRLITTIVSENKPYIAVDFAEVEYASSVGIGSLISVSRRISSAGGAFAVFNVSKEIISLLTIFRLIDIFTLLPDKQSAIKYLSEEVVRNRNSSSTSKPPKDTEDELKIVEDEVSDESVKKTANEDVAKYSEKEKPVNQTPKIANEGKLFSEPFIIECTNCNNFVRVHKGGDYLCPNCHTGFTAKDDGTIVF